MQETLILPIHEHLQLHASQYKQKTQHPSHPLHRVNNKILRTPPPHISNSEEILPASLVSPLSNSEQINHPSSSHMYTKSTPNHHYAPSVTLTHRSSLQLHPHKYHIVTPGFVYRPRRCHCTACQMDGEAGWWTTSGNIGLHPPH